MSKWVRTTDINSENRALLARRFPNNSELLSRVKSKYISEKSENGTVFRLHDGRYLLRQTDQDYCEMRVKSFLEMPPRLTMISKLYGADSVKEIWDSEIEAVDFEPDDNRWKVLPEISESQGLILFDIGRLTSILQLVENHLASLRNIRILITDTDYFLANLEEEDWQNFLTYFDENEIEIELIFVKDQSDIISSLRQFVWSKHLMLPDNILCYFHFAGTSQKALWKTIRYEYKSLVSGLGFFDDEMEMYEHTNTNLNLQDGFILQTGNQSKHGRAIVVGSGPSLDASIKKFNDIFKDSFVVAAGTAVEPLLHAGVRVDVCVILERGKDLLKVYEEMSKRVDLTRVNLVASTTVTPGLERFFRRTAYFFRPGLNIRAGFSATDQETLFGCDPTVSNTALALCASLNFEQCLLVGVDMGSVDLNRHHSAMSGYYTGGISFNHKMNIPAIAQFGGPAITNSVLHWARQSLENNIKIASKKMQIINCSNGVSISHTAAVLPDLIDRFDHFFPRVTATQPNFDDLRDSYDKGRMSYDLEELEVLVGEVKTELKKLCWNNRGELSSSLFKLLWSTGNKAAWPMIIRGSLYLLLWHAFSVIARLEKNELEEAELVFRNALIKSLDFMYETMKLKMGQ